VSNTSATGGYLTPTSPFPINDFDLSDTLNGLIVGITGLDENLVRPRYQPEPPVIPSSQTTWIAFGDTSIDIGRTLSAVQRHYPNGDGYNELRQDTLITVLVSVYGPLSQRYIELLRDGFFVDQNWEGVRSSGLKFQEIGTIRHVPELINDIWYRRYDMEVLLKREVIRSYPILNILSAQGTFVTNEGHENNFDTELVNG
jgi:hypothetical protein